MQVKEGTLWWGSDHNKFRVISITEQDGHTWVYYRNEPKTLNDKNIKEYSCYAESFVERFRQLPE